MVHARGLRRRALVVAALTVAGCASPGASGESTCTPGAACTTDNAGDCAAGHIVCTAGQPSCVADVTEQACYGGEPATLNRGICRAGKQSCIGKPLGACTGAVLPKPIEDCYNDLDDDCDGKVNNGCPSTITVGDVVDPLVARGGSGGNATSSLCPAGSLVTGVQVQLSATGVNPGYVVSVQPSCATPILVRGSSAYTITLTPATPPPAMAGTDAPRAGYSHIDCAAGGGSGVANGAQGSTTTSGRTVIESAGVDCASLGFMLDATNALHPVLTHDGMSSGKASVQVNGAVWDDGCPAGEVLVGFQGRTGAQMDQIQGICAPLWFKAK